MLGGKAQHLLGEVAYALTTGGQQHFAAQQIERLDAGGAFIQRGNARIAGNLLHAMLFDVAVAPKDLHAQVGGFESHLGQEAFENGREEAQLVVIAVVLGLVLLQNAIDHVVGQLGSVVDHGATAFGHGLLGQ